MADRSFASPEILALVDDCWANGNSIGDTILRVRRCLGVTVGFYDVRRRWVRLSCQAAELVDG